jgi:hypothetical protein
MRPLKTRAGRWQDLALLAISCGILAATVVVGWHRPSLAAIVLGSASAATALAALAVTLILNRQPSIGPAAIVEAVKMLEYQAHDLISTEVDASPEDLHISSLVDELIGRNVWSAREVADFRKLLSLRNEIVHNTGESWVSRRYELRAALTTVERLLWLMSTRDGSVNLESIGAAEKIRRDRSVRRRLEGLVGESREDRVKLTYRDHYPLHTRNHTAHLTSSFGVKPLVVMTRRSGWRRSAGRSRVLARACAGTDGAADMPRRAGAEPR